MARKRLIKGANATRVEERIARVPEDIEAESNIFRALKALERSPPDAPLPAPSVPASRPRRGPVARKGRGAAAKSSKRTEPLFSPDASKIPARVIAQAVERPEAQPTTEAQEPPRAAKRIGPSDFSPAEREAIMRCCTDYRNRLPIYLLAVKKEVEVIDSVIEKCKRVETGRRQKR